jgi:NAD(P)-dependent dehydrogenase (short-subunit alcohol dehydrogenase family)
VPAGYGRIVLTSSIGGLYGNHDVANYGVAKAGSSACPMSRPSRAPHNVTSNVIVPAAVTRMAEGIDTSAYPPMGADLVAPPSAGWRTKAVRSPARCWWRSPAGSPGRTSPRPGVYRPSWSIEDVAAQIDDIRDTTDPVVFPVVPDGHAAHIAYSFGWRP